MACFLWEDQFYEDGISISDRIAELIPHVKAEKVQEIAIEAREKMKLRHVPLLLVRHMAKYKTHKHLVAQTLERVIQRADELAEFVAIYWKDKREPLSAQVKKGLAKAFTKFSAYDLAKCNRDGKVKLKDVLFLSHAKPTNEIQAETWKKLINGTLPPPDTWEVNLSSGKDKKETWEHLISEKKLGGLAFLRNLRNMQEANVDESVLLNGLAEIKTDRILPFRFIAAARFEPQLEPQIEKKMLECLEVQEKLPGRTTLLVDVSVSMEDKLSINSDITRMDAACGVAILCREICEIANVYSFSDELWEIPSRHGFALRDAILGSQEHSGTYLGEAVRILNETGYDRLIVITDEQSRDSVPPPIKKGYIVNVASMQNGVGYGPWTHIDGWSEAVISYIREFEKSNKFIIDGESND